jgi:hypothetical protein
MVQDKRVESYIDVVKNSNEEINIPKHLSTHFKEMKLAEDLLKNLQSIKFNKNSDWEIRETKLNANLQNEDIMKNIKSIQNNLIKDFFEKNEKKV